MFNWLKNLDVGELETQEEQRVNFLILSKLYAELIKEKIQATEVFNKEK